MVHYINGYGNAVEVTPKSNNPEKPIPGFTDEVYDKVLTYAELDHLMGRLKDIGKVFFDKEGKDYIYITYAYITKLDKDKYVVQIWKSNELISGTCIYCSSSEKPYSGIPILAPVKNNINKKSAVLVDIGDWDHAKKIKNKYLEYKSIIDLMEEYVMGLDVTDVDRKVIKLDKPLSNIIVYKNTRGIFISDTIVKILYVYINGCIDTYNILEGRFVSMDWNEDVSTAINKPIAIQLKSDGTMMDCKDGKLVYDEDYVSLKQKISLIDQQ